MKKLLLLLPLLLGCGYFVDERNATEALDNLGFSELKVVDRNVFFLYWRGCGQDDRVGFEVTGKNPKGKNVKMLVCCGAVFKGCTVRGN